MIRPDSLRLARRRGPGRSKEDSRGFTLLEVMIAAVILIIVFYGLTQYYVLGRKQLDFEEQRRRALVVAQARLDEVKRWHYDYVTSLDGASSDTTITVDGTEFTVDLIVAAQTPTVYSSTVTAHVAWEEQVVPASPPVSRERELATIVRRTFGDLPVEEEDEND